MQLDVWKQPKTKRRQQERAVQLQAEALSQLPPVEISSGAILPTGYWADGSVIYSIQANTLQGLRMFQEAKEYLDLSGAFVSGLVFRPQATVYFSGWTNTTTIAAVPGPGVACAAEGDVSPELSPGDVISVLTEPTVSPARRRLAIIAAETLHLEGRETELLKPVLRDFIEYHYRTDDKEELLAVTSAIRTYVAILNLVEFPSVAALLRLERKAPPPIETEITKMVTRKLAATLPENTEALRGLADQLADLMRSYLNPRTLSKRYFSATALDAGLSLALLRSVYIPEMTDLIQRLRANWFRAMMARQARDLGSDIASRFEDARSRGACQALARLIAASETVQC